MSREGVDIVHIRDEAEADQFCVLARRFKAWNYDIMPDLSDMIEGYFASHDFEGHLARLLVDCTPPRGDALLARLDGEPVGIVALVRHPAAGAAEVNRLFVLDSARGRGIGRRLVETIVESARALGYREVVLSTLNRFATALSLYRALGFVDDTRNPDPTIGMQINLHRML